MSCVERRGCRTPISILPLVNHLSVHLYMLTWLWKNLQEDLTTCLFVRMLTGKAHLSPPHAKDPDLFCLPKLQGRGLTVRQECFCVHCLCLKASDPDPGSPQSRDCSVLIP